MAALILPVIRADSIPNRFHFCFGLMPGAQFLFAHYLAVKSAYVVNKPESITIYHAYPPAGEWWDAVQQFATVKQVNPIEEIFGRKLRHFAHRAGVLRLQTLDREGGIYMDADTLCLRPFTPLLGLNELSDNDAPGVPIVALRTAGQREAGEETP